MTKLIAAGIGVVALLCAGAPGLSAAEAPLTLAQAIAQALATSPRLATARAGIRASQAQRAAASAEGRPSADLNVAGRIEGPKVTLTLPEGQTSASPIPRLVPHVLNPSHAFEPSVSASQTLDTSGRLSAQRSAARYAEQASRARAEAESQRLVLDVTDAYLDLLEARQQMALATALRKLNQERLDVARVRLVAGTGIPLEVTQNESDLALSAQTEIEAGAQAGRAQASLNALIGRPAATPLRLADLPETAPRRPLLGPETELAAGERLHDLGQKRPDLQALRADVRQAEASVDTARAARRPQLALSSSYLWRTPATLLGRFAWSLGGALVQSLFDGGRAKAAVEAARAERARRAAGLADAERQADADVERARVTLEAAEKRLAVDEQRVAAAVAAADDARLRLAAGTVAPIELTEAQTTLARAQTDAVTGRFEAARARVRLAFAAGVAYPESVSALAGPAAP